MTGPGRALVLSVLLVCLLAACGSSPSASQAVCNDRTALSTAVSTVVNDLRGANFTKAKNDLPAVGDALNNLKQSAADLKSEQKQALSPKIDELKSTVANLKNSKSLSELRNGLDSVTSQVQSIGNEIGDTLKCS